MYDTLFFCSFIICSFFSSFRLSWHDGDTPFEWDGKVSEGGISLDLIASQNSPVVGSKVHPATTMIFSLRSAKHSATISLAATAVAGLAGGRLYLGDDGAFSVGRTARAFSTAFLVALDYKLARLYKTTLDIEDTKDSTDAQHRRNALRLLSVIESNAGLYIKLGQYISSANYVPKVCQSFYVYAYIMKLLIIPNTYTTFHRLSLTFLRSAKRLPRPRTCLTSGKPSKMSSNNQSTTYSVHLIPSQ
jgi:hypothetical protein